MGDAADAGSEFARVKSMWQTRVATREAPADIERAAARPPAMAKAPPRRKTSVLRARDPPPPPPQEKVQQQQQQQEQQQHQQQQQQQEKGKDEDKQPEAPHTPVPDEYFYASGEPESAQASPVSCASTMSVSPSRSVTSAPAGVVTSVLRSLSDATMLRKRSVSGANGPRSSSSSSAVAGGSDGADASHKDHLSLSSLPVPNLPDMSAWKEKMMSYSGKSGKPSPPPAPAAAPAGSSKLKTLASTWKSMSSMKVTLSETSSGPELAKSNVHSVCARTKPGVGNSALTGGSPYGELVVVEVLAASDLALESSDSEPEPGDVRPFAVVQFGSVVRKSLAPRFATTATGPQLVYAFNERFVFWVPSSPAIDQQTVSITFRRMSASSGVPRPQPSASADSVDDHVGEVHLSLAMPVNEVFDDWFPLVRASDGTKKGTAHLGLRRLVLTSPTLLEAAKTLASRNRSLNKADHNAFGSTLPELWSGFTETTTDVSAGESATSGSASSASVARLGMTKDALTSKLTGLSRRFMGVGLSSDARRDVF